MKRLKSGLSQVISSTLIGLIVTAVIAFCVNKEWIPSYSLTLFSVFNILANVLTMNKMRRWGIFYTFGWLAGSFIFNALGLMGTLDMVFNIVIPLVILLFRFMLWIRNSFRKIYAGSK